MIVAAACPRARTYSFLRIPVDSTIARVFLSRDQLVRFFFYLFDIFRISFLFPFSLTEQTNETANATFRRRTRKLRANVLRPLQREPRLLERSQRHRRHAAVCVRHEIAQIPRDKVADVLRGPGPKSGEILKRLFAITVEVPKQETCRQACGKVEEVVAHFSRHRANTSSIRRVKQSRRFSERPS